jgi:hypothetical protein
MADEFPLSQIIGTDLSPVQPDFVPPNLRFYIDNAFVVHTKPRIVRMVR